MGQGSVQQVGQPVPTGRASTQPTGRVQRATGEDIAAGGAMDQFDPLAQAGELHGVLTHHVAGAEAGVARRRADCPVRVRVRIGGKTELSEDLRAELARHAYESEYVRAEFFDRVAFASSSARISSGLRCTSASAPSTLNSRRCGSNSAVPN